MDGSTIADWAAVGGLIINAGLLLGLIVQIRSATEARREDLRTSSQRATLDAWNRLVELMMAAEVLTRTYFGRGRISVERAHEFLDEVVSASGRIALGDETSADADSEIIRANEGLRSILNSAEDFAVAVDIGAYDRTTAERVAGYRLSRVVLRHRGYTELIRRSVDDDDIYGTLERFARSFMQSKGQRLEDLPILVGHGDMSEDLSLTSAQG
jgi:hypothetical protein